MSRLLFESRAAVLACEAKQALTEKEIELEKLKQQRKQWVGLTDDDIQEVRENCGVTHHAIKTIEAKLREKNHG